jgi:hypothetical protein
MCHWVKAWCGGQKVPNEKSTHEYTNFTIPFLDLSQLFQALALYSFSKIHNFL